MSSKRTNSADSERGIALIVVLLSILLLSTMVAGTVFVSQTQVWTSYNYRLTTQARYAAEAGIQKTMNWVTNTYTPPASFGSYNTGTFPVQATANNASVILSALSGTASNYPTASVQTAYNAALSSQSIPGVSEATFSTYATLLRMTPGAGVSWLGAGTGGVPQTWQITSVGSVGAAGNILGSTAVQLQETYERIGTPIFTYGVAGDGTSCPDVNFSGGTMDAWNSAAGTYAATHQNTGGNIGSNGNVTLTGGSTVVHGIISDSSNINVGSSCALDGITNSVGGTPWNGLQLLTQPLVYPNPTVPNPMTPNTNINVNSNTCWSGSPSGCSTSSSTAVCGVGNTPCVVLAPNSPAATATNYGNITSNSNLMLSAGTYYINSLNLNGGSITLTSTPVVIILGGNGIGSGNTLFASQSSTTINDGGIPGNLEIVSACCTTGSPPVQMANPPVITMNASSSLYGVVYAPNSYVHITGSSHFLGAVVGQKVTSDSSGGFSYDLALQNSLLQIGSFVPVNFSWNKF